MTHYFSPTANSLALGATLNNWMRLRLLQDPDKGRQELEQVALAIASDTEYVNDEAIAGIAYALAESHGVKVYPENDAKVVGVPACSLQLMRIYAGLPAYHERSSCPYRKTSTAIAKLVSYSWTEDCADEDNVVRFNFLQGLIANYMRTTEISIPNMDGGAAPPLQIRAVNDEGTERECLHAITKQVARWPKEGRASKIAAWHAKCDRSDKLALALGKLWTEAIGPHALKFVQSQIERLASFTSTAEESDAGVHISPLDLGSNRLRRVADRLLAAVDEVAKDKDSMPVDIGVDCRWNPVIAPSWIFLRLTVPAGATLWGSHNLTRSIRELAEKGEVRVYLIHNFSLSINVECIPGQRGGNYDAPNEIQKLWAKQIFGELL